MSCGSVNSSSGAPLAQLVAVGAADVYLTAKPCATYWRLRVQQCTNFAMESLLQTFVGTTSWGSDVSCTLNRTGDLIYWMYCLIDIPAIVGRNGSGSNGGSRGLDFPWGSVCNPCSDEPEPDNCLLLRGSCHSGGGDEGDDHKDEDEDCDDDCDDDCYESEGPYANYVNEIGFAAISRAAFSIGGQVIDCVYSHYLHMWEELSGKPGKRLTEMIGKRLTRAQLVKDSSRARRLYVPLPFYFTRHSGNALPLVSLQFHSVQVHITFAPLSKLVQVSDCNVAVYKCEQGQQQALLSSTDMFALLDTTYIYLDMEERDRFASSNFTQLITQVQNYTTTGRSSTIRAQLNFNHPTLELIWALQRDCQKDANNTFDYSGAWGQDPITRATLRINNNARFDREAPYFRMVQPYQAHTNIPQGFIYCYSFALHPEDCQPSGSLNFSRIDNTEFVVEVQKAIADTSTELVIYARSWNIIRLREGLGGLIFSN